jgi:tetratricopeptide (TPR) repeat protein
MWRARHPLLSLPAACAALLATLVYLNALDNPFVYDDFRLIVENPFLALSNLWPLIARDMTRPIVNLSYAADTVLWGRSPVGYHVTNVILHALNVVLVFRVASLGAGDVQRQATARAWSSAPPVVVAFATAALFAVHPMMTQAVGYIAGRSEVAYATFFLAAFLAGRRWMLGGGPRWWVACVGLWLIGVLTKETAAMLPVVLLGYDRLVLDADSTERRRRWRRLELPLLAATALAALFRVAVLRLVEFPGDTLPDWRYALVTIDGFWQYLGLFLVPRNQSIFHAIPFFENVLDARALAGLAGLSAYVVGAWALRHVHSLIPVGLLWFGALLVPSAVLAILGRGEPIAEHRAYLPAVGLFLAAGCGFGELWARAGRVRRLVAAIGVILLASLSGLTLARNDVWGDPVRLSREAVELAPGHWLPRVLVAEALRQQGRCDEAVVEYRTAIAIRPSDEFPYPWLARCLIEGGRIGEAEQVLRQLHAVNPTSQYASLALGFVAAADGRVDEARAHFADVLAHHPGDPQAGRMLAFIEGTLRDVDRVRICAELQRLGGRPPRLEACRG